MTRRAAHTCSLALVACTIAAAWLGGCSTNFLPRGSGYSGDADTYESTTWSPKTVELVDVRTDQVIWSIDIPVGQKLSFVFKEDTSGDRDPHMPEVMSWVVQPINSHSWRGRQKMKVPDPTSRLVVMSLRDAPEQAPREEAVFDAPPPALEPEAQPEATPMPAEQAVDENGTPIQDAGGD